MEPTDHDCPLRQVVAEQGQVVAKQGQLIAELKQQLVAALAQMQVLERQVLGPKSEKMPPPAQELRREESEDETEARRLTALERRRERAALREKLREQTVTHHVTAQDAQCPKCGGTAERPVGDGKQTTIYEYVPGYFVRQKHIQEKRACSCGEYISTAASAPRAIDKGQYGPGFIAHLIVMKCADSIPLY